MAWHSGKPADGDLLSASAQYIRENFAELEPLQPHIAAILDSRIVEMGSNSNGEYVRWENGLQVCWASRNLGPTTLGSGLLADMYRTDVFDHSFPAAFTAPPGIGVVAWREEGSGGNAVVGAFCRGITKDVIELIQGWAGTMTDGAIYASWIAIGRWK